MGLGELLPGRAQLVIIGTLVFTPEQSNNGEREASSYLRNVTREASSPGGNAEFGDTGEAIYCCRKGSS